MIGYLSVLEIAFPPAPAPRGDVSDDLIPPMSRTTLVILAGGTILSSLLGLKLALSAIP